MKKSTITRIMMIGALFMAMPAMAGELSLFGGDQWTCWAKHPHHKDKKNGRWNWTGRHSNKWNAMDKAVRTCRHHMANNHHGHDPHHPDAIDPRHCGVDEYWCEKEGGHGGGGEFQWYCYSTHPKHDNLAEWKKWGRDEHHTREWSARACRDHMEDRHHDKDPHDCYTRCQYKRRY